VSELVLRWVIYSAEGGVASFRLNEFKFKAISLKNFHSIRQVLLLLTSETPQDSVLPDFLKARDVTGELWTPFQLRELPFVLTSELTLLDQVGEGHSGIVFKGILRNSKKKEVLMT
jgi:hypothetical protein